MKKELFTKLILAMVVILAGVSFTSCDNDDDEPQTQVYSYGWEDLSAVSSDLNYLKEMGAAGDVFESALGTDSPFTMNGSSTDCDAKVKAACQQAAESLKGKTWGFTARFVVYNNTTGQVVYSLQFTQGETL